MLRRHRKHGPAERLARLPAGQRTTGSQLNRLRTGAEDEKDFQFTYVDR